MKLGRLTIHNIASIADAEIDFGAAPLSNADVFLISGDTGAGKSTILDCICLALYATVPRLATGRAAAKYNEINSNDQRQLLRSGTGEGFVSLDFEGNDGHAYSAAWAVRRSRNKADSRFQKTDWSLIVDGDAAHAIVKVKEIEARIKEAIGVDYVQFVRTSMLAQGEFTRFLNADDREKSEILEKLTGTSHFKAIGAEVYRLTAERKSVVDRLQLQLDGVTLLSEEEKKSVEASLADMKSQVAAMSASIEILSSKIVWIEQEARLASAAGVCAKALEAAMETLGSEETAAARLLVSQRAATASAREQVRALRLAKADYEEAKNAAAALAPKWQRLLADVEILRGQLDAVKPLKEKINVFLQKRARWRIDFGNYKEVIALLDRADNSADLSAFVDEACTVFNEEDIAEAGNAAEKLKQARQYLADCSNAKAMADRCMRDEAALADEKKEYDALCAEIGRLKESAIAAKATAEALRKVCDASAEALAGVEAGNKEWARNARATLKEGCTCPVCLQTVATLPPVEEVLARRYADAAARASADKKAFDEALHEAERLTLAAESAHASVLKADARIKKLSEMLVAEKAKIKSACEQNGIEADDDGSALAEAVSKAEQQVARCENAMAAESVASAAVAALKAIENRGRELGARLATSESSMKVVLASMPEWAALPAGVSANVAPERYLPELAARIQSCSDRITRSKAATERLELAVQSFVDSSQNMDRQRLEQLADVPESEFDRVAERLAAIERRVAECRAASEENRRQTEAHRAMRPPFADGETENSLREAKTSADAALAELNRNMGAMQQKLAADDEAQTNRRKLIDEHAAARLEWLKWKRLDNLLGSATGDVFNRIAQSYVLGDLLERANVYLSRLTPRYRLTGVGGTYLILLEDAFNGYRKRPVVTSSGGESFLVSLSLALALADVGSAISADTLFIDEGFGTLSGEPLQRAVAMLRSLNSSSGRRVGIISHVAELKSEIPVQILVSRSPSTEASEVKVVSKLRP